MIIIPLPSPPRMVSLKDNKATFVLEGLYPGYGITIANAIRRIILSSLSGSAVIAVKIKDIDHEFSTIPGVTEDVISILLNIKKIRFKVYEEGYFEGHLHMKGERNIVAGDFKVPSEVEIINTDLPIATLTDKKGELEMTLWITQGIGYELGKEHILPPSVPNVGVIKLDSIFTPVLVASFKIENMRVGERTDYNRITFNVETDGTITPKEAFERAVATLIQQLSVFGEVAEEKKVVKKSKEIELTYIKEKFSKEELKQGSKEPVLSGRYLISHLKLSSRIEKILRKHRIKTIGQLVKQNEERLMKMDGIGDAAVKEIRRKLGKAGFLLGSSK